MRLTWTKEMIDKLKELYPDNYTKDIAKIFNTTERSVYSQATLYGLKKSPEFRKMELGKQAERLRSSGVAHRYSKGHTPANKGVPMSDDLYSKVSQTMFKKGHTPHNTKFDGHERIDKDGYVLIRVKEGKYVHKNRYVYEQAHGPIPKGMVCVFKDGNKRNFDIDNIILITKRENMLRNSIMNYPPELRDTMKLVKKVKRKIGEIDNGNQK